MRCIRKTPSWIWPEGAGRYARRHKQTGSARKTEALAVPYPTSGRCRDFGRIPARITGDHDNFRIGSRSHVPIWGTVHPFVDPTQSVNKPTATRTENRL